MDTRLCIVVGTRAQLIKVAPVMQELQQRALPYYFLYTAQHKNTIDTLLTEFGLKRPDQTLLGWHEEARSIALFGSWLFKAMWKLRLARTLVPFRGGVVLVHGDTASAVWGALLGKLSGNRVFHLESGLRSFNLLHPFPEEIQRLATFVLSDIYACPSEQAVQNLRRFKGVKLNTGHNTIVDALREALICCEQPDQARPYVVVSIHRFENIFNAQRLSDIVSLVIELSTRWRLEFVLHPATRRQLAKAGLLARLSDQENVVLRDRMPYAQFISLLARAEFVITDGGSNQEELSYLGVPTLLMRRVTERQEGLGKNILLSGYDPDTIWSFVADYARFRQPPVVAESSPSAMIVDWLAEQGVFPGTE